MQVLTKPRPRSLSYKLEEPHAKRVGRALETPKSRLKPQYPCLSQVPIRRLDLRSKLVALVLQLQRFSWDVFKLLCR